MFVEKLLVVAHLDARLHAVLQVAIEVDQVRVDVVEQRAFWFQSEGDCEPAAKRFYVTALRMFVPDRFQMRHEPAFAAGPFQRRLESHCHAAPREASFRQSAEV